MSDKTPENGSGPPLDDVAPTTPGNRASLSPAPRPVLIPLCTSWDFDQDCDPDCTNTQDAVYRAWALDDVIWKDDNHEPRKELGVKFLNNIPPKVGNPACSSWTYKGKVMKIDDIMSWANEWSDSGNGVIPKFTLVNDPDAPSDIRVEFTSNGKTEAEIGNRAEGLQDNEATMWLCLYTDDGKGCDCLPDDYKKHLVIHEFGHALGLGHEHQRSDFWQCIEPYIDRKKMKKELGVSDKHFKLNWYIDKDFYKAKRKPYDKDSVMHYWFKKEWLTHGYSDKSEVKEEGDLGDEERAALLSVHERDGCLVNNPSDRDIQLLKEFYGALSS